MRVLSLGWGVQSFTLAAMSALGESERVNVALHADTTHERSSTYHFAAKYTPWLVAHDINVVTVTATRVDPANEHDHPPYITDPSDGRLRRKCTGAWKIAPIRRWLQENRNGQPVEQWIGISTDEALRMRLSDVKYITNRYPLIERGSSRQDCIAWLKNKCLDVPMKSARIFCPYRNLSEWRQVKNSPGDWKAAIETDNAIRNFRSPNKLYIHPTRKSLEEVDLRTQEEKGQLRLWDEECSGLCGV